MIKLVWWNEAEKEYVFDRDFIDVADCVTYLHGSFPEMKPAQYQELDQNGKVLLKLRDGDYILTYKEM